MHILLILLVMLVSALSGRPGHAQFFFFQNPVTLDNLDGNYRTLASCAYQRLARREGLSRADQQGVVKLSSGTDRWELSFVNDDGGRQTRLDWTSGPYPGEHVLSTVRACAA
jgi:hypothetical protein